MNKDIDIIIHSMEDSDPDVVRYKGFVTNSPDYNLDMSLRGEEIYGSVTNYERKYNIFPIDVVVDGKIIHYVAVYDIVNSRMEEEKYPVDPLNFGILNEDSIKHDFSVEVFDPYNKSIFKESYSIEPDEKIESLDISEELELHRYVYTLIMKKHLHSMQELNMQLNNLLLKRFHLYS
ncbi:hypothetical protein [Methanolobus sp.]|uniref:hypothetical protein n=1 Tax=Methanolobus sp. TaxID=1874737 RepID=UPI0025CF2EF3|nr:hypothetical protein [Methanolobus sp.]